ncbi:MAG TPA: hypothetical protein VK187_05720 [Geobacteraceae bacterium]|nr:hypothetical protein [Geobacteraceae bacterium]
MQGLLDRILTANLIFTTLIFYASARIYLLPKIEELKPRIILVPILLLHSLRHLGLMFLTPGAVYPGMPPQFAYPAAIGDFITALLAFTAIPAVMNNRPRARFQVRLFNVIGTLDLALAITLATLYKAPPYMGAAYWIPAFWVPALLVTHYIVFVVLALHKPHPGTP